MSTFIVKPQKSTECIPNHFVRYFKAVDDDKMLMLIMIIKSIYSKKSCK